MVSRFPSSLYGRFVNDRNFDVNARLLIIATEGGDWGNIRRLISAGRLPALKQLITRGIAGVLDLEPQSGVTFWSSVATGQEPVAHGITAPIEARPDGGGFQPIGAKSWRAVPIWEILSAENILTATVAWPATSPATSWSGYVIDPRFLITHAASLADWPLSPRCVSPDRLRTPLRSLRVHSRALDAGASAASDPPTLAAAASVHAVVTYLVQRENPRLLMAHYGHILCANDKAAEIFDAMLARLILLLGSDADIVLVSAKGMLVAAGPGFAGNTGFQNSKISEIAPTILARFGLRFEHMKSRPFAGTRQTSCA
jgi:hypothetical protein